MAKLYIGNEQISGSASETKINLAEFLTIDSLSDLNKFLSQKKPENKQFDFIEGKTLNLQTLKAFDKAALKLAFDRVTEKQYKTIPCMPSEDQYDYDTGDYIISDSDLYINYTITTESFPSTAIQAFLTSNVEIPVLEVPLIAEAAEEGPTVYSPASWDRDSYLYPKNPNDFQDYQDYQLEDTDFATYFILNVSDYDTSYLPESILETYTQTLTNQGWTISNVNFDFSGESYIGYTAHKDTVNLIIGATANHIIMFIRDDNEDVIYMPQGAYIPTCSYSTTLNNYLAQDISLPTIGSDWNEIEINVDPALGYGNHILKEDETITGFPNLNEFLKQYPYCCYVWFPLPTEIPLETSANNWTWGIHNYNSQIYLRAYNDENVFNAGSPIAYKEMLEEAGWVVEETTISIGDITYQNGYRATHARNQYWTILFARENEIFDWAIIDLTPELSESDFSSRLYISMWGQTSIDLASYFNTLENDGWNKLIIDDLQTFFTKENLSLNVYAEIDNGNGYLELTVYDNRLRIIEEHVNKNLYFNRIKDIDDIPIFEYNEEKDNIQVKLYLNSNNIEGIITNNSSLEIDITDILSSKDITDFNNFLTKKASNKTFNFIDGKKLDLSGYNKATLNIDAEVENSLEPKYTYSNPGQYYDFENASYEDNNFNSSEAYTDQEFTYDSFPSEAIKNFLASDITIPQPQGTNSTWEANVYTTWDVMPQEEQDVYYEEDYPTYVYFVTICNGTDSDAATQYVNTLESAGWTVTQSEIVINRDMSYPDGYVATKDNVTLKFANIEVDKGYFVFGLMIKENDPIRHQFMSDEVRTFREYPSAYLSTYLVENNLPVPAFIDQFTQWEAGTSDDLHNYNETKEHVQPDQISEEKTVSVFPIDQIEAFIYYHPILNNVIGDIPTPQVNPDIEVEDDPSWNWSIHVRKEKGSDEDGECDFHMEKPYTYLYIYNNQRYYNASDYAALLEDAGWTVEQTSVWAGYTYEEGYKATKGCTIIQFGSEEEYFELAITDLTPSFGDAKPFGMYINAAKNTEESQESEEASEEESTEESASEGEEIGVRNYVDTLISEGWELVKFNEEDPSDIWYNLVKDNVFISIDSDTYNYYNIFIWDCNLITTYEETHKKLYFNKIKEIEGVPTFEFNDLIQKNSVKAYLNEDNIQTLTVSSSGGGGGSSYAIDLSEYYNVDTLPDVFAVFDGSYPIEESFLMNFDGDQAEIDLESLADNDSLSFSLYVEGNGDPVEELNYDSRSGETYNGLPMSDIQARLSTGMDLPYPTVQNDGYSGNNWYCYLSDGWFYAEPNWSNTYFSVSAFISDLQSRGWTILQDGDICIAYTSNIVIGINKSGQHDGNSDKICNLHYIRNGNPSGDLKIKFSKKTSLNDVPSFEHLNILGGSLVKFVLHSNGIYVQLGGGSGSGDASVELLAPAWQSDYYYNRNDLVSYNKKIYCCSSNHTSASSFDNDSWAWYETTLYEGVKESISSIAYSQAATYFSNNFNSSFDNRFPSSFDTRLNAQFNDKFDARFNEIFDDKFDERFDEVMDEILNTEM